MKIGPFQFRDVHKDDKDADPFELVAQMFRQVRDIVDQINKAPFASDNVLRHLYGIPTQKATDERPVLIVPIEFTSIHVDAVQLALRSNLGSGTVFTLNRTSATEKFPIATYDTAQGSITALTPVSMTLKGDEKLVLKGKDVLSLAITGNTPDEGLLQLDLSEVFP